MTADDLTAPLGRRPKKRRRLIELPLLQIIAGALVLLLAVFVLWAMTDDPVNLKFVAKSPESAAPQRPAPAPPESRAPAPSAPVAQPVARPNSTTVTIVDGKTGEKKEVVVPAPLPATTSANSSATPERAH